MIYTDGYPPIKGQTPNPSAANSQYSYPQPYGGAPSPYQQTASPVYQNFSPGGQPQFPPSTQYTPGYSPQSFPAGTPGQPTPAYGNTPPPLSQQPTPQNPTPPQPASAFPQRPGSLPTAPSLPQRPSFGAPQVNAFQMQQMHMGHSIPGTVQPGTSNGEKAAGAEAAPISASVDDLISGAAKAADQAVAGGTPAAEEKPAKKDKSKQARLVYSDNETSPEEKMSKLPRYAFVPDRQAETVLEELPAASVVGTVRETDTVVDPAH